MTRPGYVVYQWLTSQEFLLPALFPDSVRIDASPSDEPEAIERQLGDAGWFHFHLNCTRTARFPLRRAELIERIRARGVTPINALATDISKRAVQRTCAAANLNVVTATRSGDPDEMIIVKTDLNFGGSSEWALTNEDRTNLDLGAGSGVMWKPNDYRVLRRGEIEEAWWDDETLVRERYIDNDRDRWFRIFVFLGQMVVCELTDPSLIKKVGHSAVAQVWPFSFNNADAPALSGLHGRIAGDVRAFTNTMGVDFGAIDVVLDRQDEPFIIDVNTTPAYTYPIDTVVEHLRLGLPSDTSG